MFSVNGQRHSVLPEDENVTIVPPVQVRFQEGSRRRTFILSLSVPHLGGISGVPVIAFWSEVTDVLQRQPGGENMTVASVGPECSPCFKRCKKPICMEHDPRLVARIFNERL